MRTHSILLCTLLYYPYHFRTLILEGVRNVEENCFKLMYSLSDKEANRTYKSVGNYTADPMEAKEFFSRYENGR